jgi:hypothetical protein
MISSTVCLSGPPAPAGGLALTVNLKVTSRGTARLGADSDSANLNLPCRRVRLAVAGGCSVESDDGLPVTPAARAANSRIPSDRSGQPDRWRPVTSGPPGRSGSQGPGLAGHGPTDRRAVPVTQPGGPTQAGPLRHRRLRIVGSGRMPRDAPPAARPNRARGPLAGCGSCGPTPSSHRLPDPIGPGLGEP